jgi:hypothetical protein
MALNFKKPATLSPEEIEAFEAKSKGRIKVQTVRFASEETPDVPATFLIHQPSRMTLEAVGETSEKKGSMAGQDLLINSCVLAGPLAELEYDDAMYFGLGKAIGELVDAKKKL